MESGRVRIAEVDDCPPDTAEMTLIRWCVSAYLETCHLRPKERGPAFVRTLARIAEAEQKIASIRPTRAAHEPGMSLRARRQADAALSVLLPTLIAALPGEEE